MNHTFFPARTRLINPQRYLNLEKSQLKAVLQPCQPCTTVRSWLSSLLPAVSKDIHSYRHDTCLAFSGVMRK